eukprot:g539.t1 g539   contig10:255778-256928(-)
MLNADPSITLDLFTVCLIIASILYSFCLVLAKRKWFFLRRLNGSMLDTKKLLILSAATACFLRILSFVGVIAMEIANVRAHYSLKPSRHEDQEHENHPIDKDQGFYDSAMTVMFDLPNAIIVSTYVLLTLVWAECSLLSRFHTENSVQWRKKWLLWYMIFNTALYATQIVLYILIFVGGGESSQVEVVRNIVNVAMAGINLSSVFLVFILYIYLGVTFSGFPYRSQTSKESLREISKVMAFWSLSRIVWGASMLAIYIHDVDLLRPSQGGWIPMAFLLQLIFCEIAPIIVLMDYSFMTIFDFGSSREMPSLASRQHDMAMNERRSWNVEESPRRSDDASSEAEEPLLNRSIS